MALSFGKCGCRRGPDLGGPGPWGAGTDPNNWGPLSVHDLAWVGWYQMIPAMAPGRIIQLPVTKGLSVEVNTDERGSQTLRFDLDQDYDFWPESRYNPFSVPPQQGRRMELRIGQSKGVVTEANAAQAFYIEAWIDPVATTFDVEARIEGQLSVAFGASANGTTPVFRPFGGTVERRVWGHRKYLFRANSHGPYTVGIAGMPYIGTANDHPMAWRVRVRFLDRWDPVAFPSN